MTSKRVKNILTGDWVITSPEGRLSRPWKGGLEDDNKAELEKKRLDDPLAPLAKRGNGTTMPDYEFTHVFPNDFPVFSPVGTVEYIGESSEGNEKAGENHLFVSEVCTGISHVMTYSPDFYKHFASMNKWELSKVFQGWLDFFSVNKEKYEYIQIFENRGAEVGSSLPHPHCQIWSTNFIPTITQKMLDNQKAYFTKHNSHMLLDYLSKELNQKTRIITELDHFVILVPFWAYWPYETMILPKRSVQRIDQFSEDEIINFMEAIQLIMGKYDTMFDCFAPLVMGFRNAPVGSFLNKNLEFWQFHVNIYPPFLVKGRKKFMAGYELISEVQRDFSVELAAERLRDTIYNPPK